MPIRHCPTAGRKTTIAKAYFKRCPRFLQQKYWDVAPTVPQHVFRCYWHNNRLSDVASDNLQLTVKFKSSVCRAQKPCPHLHPAHQSICVVKEVWVTKVPFNVLVYSDNCVPKRSSIHQLGHGVVRILVSILMLQQITSQLITESFRIISKSNHVSITFIRTTQKIIVIEFDEEWRKKWGWGGKDVDA
jgi:hypothetical protein